MKKLLLIISLFLVGVHMLRAEEMPHNYYARIDGLKDAELKATLREIIRPHTVIEYGNGLNHTWEVFYYCDQDENGYCIDMYCDTWQKFTTPGNAVSGCNIEHSFAKSWWGGAQYDQYKDCHHLNPSNSTANSTRSNYPLGEIPAKHSDKYYKESGSLKIDKIHHDSLNEDFFIWEPKDEYKGDFARAYFYMATCYGHDLQGNVPDLKANGKKNYVGWRTDNTGVGSRYAMQNNNYLEFQTWESDLLIKWSRQDKVSEKELKRMDAVSDFQHNRNPFIDYPELAEYIWGNKKGFTVNLAELIGESTSLNTISTTEPAARLIYRNGQLLIESAQGIFDVTGRKICK